MVWREGEVAQRWLTHSDYARARALTPDNARDRPDFQLDAGTTARCSYREKCIVMLAASCVRLGATELQHESIRACVLLDVRPAAATATPPPTSVGGVFCFDTDSSQVRTFERHFEKPGMRVCGEKKNASKKQDTETEILKTEKRKAEKEVDRGEPYTHLSRDCMCKRYVETNLSLIENKETRACLVPLQDASFLTTHDVTGMASRAMKHAEASGSFLYNERRACKAPIGCIAA